MVTFNSPRGVTLSRNASDNGFPPSTVARKFKQARHLGDFAESELGRERRAERRARLADKRSMLDAR